MSAANEPDRTLDAAQAAAWTEGLNRFREAAGCKTRSMLMDRAFGKGEGDKASLSRFFNGDTETLTRWLDRRPQQYAEPLAKALKIPVDALHALFDKVRSGGSPSVAAWHPSFPGLSLAAVEMDCFFEPSLADFKAGDLVTLVGVRGDGLDVALGQLERDWSNVEVRERREGDRPPRLQKTRVIHLRRWGVAQVRGLIAKLLGEETSSEGKPAGGPALVHGEAAERLAALARHLDAQPVLPPIRRVREIIEWLGRVSRGASIGDGKGWFALAVDSERARWREGASADALRWLADDLIVEVVRRGWSNEASSRAQWEVAAADSMRPAAPPKELEAVIKGLSAKPTKADLETAVRVLTLCDQPQVVVDALIAGAVLMVVPEGAVVLANPESARALVGRWVANDKAGARWWVANAQRAGSLDVLRSAAAEGLPWDRLQAALASGGDMDPVDRCRAVVAFSAHTANVDAIVVDQVFVRRWAGAMRAAMISVYEQATMSKSRWEALIRPIGRQTFLPAETDLVTLANRLGHRLPLFMPENFTDVFLNQVDPDVQAVVRAWTENVPTFWEAFAPGPGDLYALFRVLAPSCAWPSSFLEWEEQVWVKVEQRAEHDDEVRELLATWPIAANDKPPMRGDAPTSAQPPERRGDFVRVDPPLAVLLRWATRGNYRRDKALERWVTLHSGTKSIRCGDADDAAWLGELEEALRKFDRGAVERALVRACGCDSVANLKHLLGTRPNQSLSAAVALADRLDCKAVLDHVSKEARAPISSEIFGDRFKGPEDPACGWTEAARLLEGDLSSVVELGLSAACALARKGELAELHAWSEWNLREACGEAVLDSYGTQFALACVPSGRILPSDDLCEAQVAVWLDGGPQPGPLDERSNLALSKWLPSIDAARKARSSEPLRLAASMYQSVLFECSLRPGGESETERLLRRQVPRLGNDRPWAIAIVQTVLAIAGRDNWLPLTPAVIEWAKGARRGDTEAWCDNLQRSIQQRAAQALLPKSNMEPRSVRPMSNLDPEPELSAEQRRLQAFWSLVNRKEPDTDATRAVCLELAEAARRRSPEGGRLPEVLYWSIRGHDGLEQVVRACLEAADFANWLDDFEVVKDPSSPYVIGGRRAALALAATHATEAQVWRLICDFPNSVKLFSSEDYHSVSIEQPGGLRPSHGGSQEALKAIALARVPPERLLELSWERQCELGMISWRCEHIPLEDARSRLAEVLALPELSMSREGDQMGVEMEALIGRFAASDSAFIDSAEAWLKELGPLHFAANTLLDFVLVTAPERAVAVYRKWLRSEDAEVLGRARYWLASDANDLPGGGELLRSSIRPR